ncbi:restriction endonuclease subunit S [Pseudoalteromonas agarivorans]|uniref:Restriction endonuclease subunit S n=1 Tax=Pseudoalteromonas agarivorans TaxID=176102 RepID=A0AAD0U6A1_9GAMM|nr:restriction endonuclease subunit S [Pseudoalteromonas agarivorans]AYM88770.1 restriction endonuclease subunit S [Pseudoalteromonas agarivorans]
MVPSGFTALNDFVSSDAPICYGILKPGSHIENGIPVVKVKNIFSGKIHTEKLLKTSTDIHHQYKRAELKSGDVLLTIRGTTGRVAIVQRELDGANITQDTARIRVSTEDCSLYLFYALQSPQTQRQIVLNTVGQAVKGINIAEVKKLNILHPPRAEQQKIAKILSTWDKAISATERLIDNSKQQKKALMQQLLTGKKRLLDDSGKSYDSEWRFSTFSELFKVANNKKTQVKSSEYLSEGKTPIVDQGKQLISGYTNNDEKYTELPVIIFGDHTRVVKWVNFAFAQGADGTQVLKSTKLLNDKYAYYLLSDTDIPNLGYSRHMRELKEKDFKYPTDIREQERIASVLTNADKEIDLLEQQLADLKQEKKALMQQLLTGKRRVKT